MFYQSQNSLQTDFLKLEDGSDFSFPPHLHSTFELITVSKGEMSVLVDGKQYILRDRKALLIFPNQVHSLSTPEHSCHFLCIFSPQLVQAYHKIFSSKVPVSNLFEIDPFYVRQLMALQKEEAPAGLMAIKGLLYSVCAAFDSTATYADKSKEQDELLSEIFQFVEANYNKDCSLSALAKHTSFHYVYLSHYFRQRTGLSFTDYVNRYRINEAGYILKNTHHTILQTAYDCGFDSLRSFNRNFKKVMEVTPSQYRAKL